MKNIVRLNLGDFEEQTKDLERMVDAVNRMIDAIRELQQEDK